MMMSCFGMIEAASYRIAGSRCSKRASWVIIAFGISGLGILCHNDHVLKGLGFRRQTRWLCQEFNSGER
jgi:hypothetical protein